MKARWRAAIRLAVRELGRAKGRSALLAALIGLPVVFLAAGSVVYRSYQLTTTEKFERANGAANVELEWIGFPVEQAPAGGSNFQPVGNGPGAGPVVGNLAPAPAPDTIRRALGAGARVIERTTETAVMSTGTGVTYAKLTALNYDDPIARGLVHQSAGRPPKTAGEVDVSIGLARAAGLRIGSALSVFDPSVTLEVVGVVSDPATAKPVREAFVAAGSVARSATNYLQTDYLAFTPAPVTWSDVLRLNELGYSVQSRFVVAHPPPASEVAFKPRPQSPLRKSLIIGGALIVGMGLIEVVLLAGPALAVIARRQERSLALIAASGGEGRDLRNTVLSFGLVLGAVAGMGAVITGAVLGAASLPWVAHLTTDRPGPLRWRPLDLGVLVVLSLFTAMAAALAPARAAASTDVVASLGGRKSRRPVRLRIPVVSVVLAIAGVALALHAAQGGHVSEIIAGVALMELALLIATPILLVVAARFGKWLPLAPRLAVRDAGRNRGSAAPAAAAVMAAVIGCVAVIGGAATLLERDTRTYQPAAAYGEVFAYTGPSMARLVAAAMRANLPGASVSVLSSVVDASIVPRVSAGERGVTRASSNSDFGLSVVVAGEGDLLAITGVDDPAARAALAAGKAVVADPWQVRGGMATFDVIPNSMGSAIPIQVGGQASAIPIPVGGQAPATQVVSVPAVALSRGFFPAPAIVPPSLAHDFGVVKPLWVVAYNRSLPTAAQMQSLNRSLIQIAGAHPDPRVGIITARLERGFHDPLLARIWLLALVAAAIAVGAAGISTALSNADRSEDFLTLEAVGASPATRRTVSAARAGVIAVTGTVLGAAAGIVPVLAYIIASNRSSARVANFPMPGIGGPGQFLMLQPSERMHLVVPYAHLGLILVGVPLVATAMAGVLTRSRISARTVRTV